MKKAPINVAIIAVVCVVTAMLIGYKCGEYITAQKYIINYSECIIE